MNNDQHILLTEILNKIVEALYPHMGQEWCKDVWESISQLKHAGKP